MTAVPIRTSDTNDHAVGTPSRRGTAASGLVTVVALAASFVAAAAQDVSTDAQLHQYLDVAGWRLAVSWLVSVVAGLAWLLFVIGLRGILPASPGRDLFTAGALLGQAAIWAGASLHAAVAPHEAHGLPLAVYHALGEAAHLTTAAGTAAIGLALIGLARAGTSAAGSPAGPRVTAAVGTLLMLGAVIGPVWIPVYLLWLLITSLRLLRWTRRTKP